MFPDPPPRRASNESASGLRHALDAGLHFLFFDELALVSLFDALSHASAKAAVVLRQAQRRVLYQLLGLDAFIGGDLREPCFLVGGEMHFHKVSVDAKLGS